MAAARLDARIKQQIKESLKAYAYAPMHRKAAIRLQGIISANTTASRYLHQSFSYKGAYHTFEIYHPRFKNQRLLPELHAEMDAYLADMQEVVYTEEPYVLGFFNKVLNASNSMEDYLLLLPECVHKAMEEYMDASWANHHYPRELSDVQVLHFQQEHRPWIVKLKTRMLLDLIT